MHWGQVILLAKMFKGTCCEVHRADGGEAIAVVERRTLLTRNADTSSRPAAWRGGHTSACSQRHDTSATSSDESWRETTYEMRLRFEAIPFRREMMINTITTNRTPETTRIIVGSIEHSLHVHGTQYGCRSAASP
jgi:hypothetical protein